MNKNLVVNNNQIGDNHATFHELMQEKGKVIDELIMDRVNRIKKCKSIDKKEFSYFIKIYFLNYQFIIFGNNIKTFHTKNNQ